MIICRLGFILLAVRRLTDGRSRVTILGVKCSDCAKSCICQRTGLLLGARCRDIRVGLMGFAVWIVMFPSDSAIIIYCV